MDFQVRYDAENKIVIATIHGLVSPITCVPVDLKTVEVAEENHTYRLLSDLRQADLLGGTLDIYELPKVLSSKGLVLKYAHALLVDHLCDELKFFETVSINRGYRVRVFMSYEKAVAWLQEAYCLPEED
jgi:hypothetical protein